VWQGRFKSFPIQQDYHLSTVLRYVLLNPVSAGLVMRAAQWHWTSLNPAYPPDPWPLPRLTTGPSAGSPPRCLRRR